MASGSRQDLAGTHCGQSACWSCVGSAGGGCGGGHGACQHQTPEAAHCGNSWRTVVAVGVAGGAVDVGVAVADEMDENEQNRENVVAAAAAAFDAAGAEGAAA